MANTTQAKQPARRTRCQRQTPEGKRETTKTPSLPHGWWTPPRPGRPSSARSRTPAPSVAPAASRRPRSSGNLGSPSPFSRCVQNLSRPGVTPRKANNQERPGPGPSRGGQPEQPRPRDPPASPPSTHTHTHTPGAQPPARAGWTCALGPGGDTKKPESPTPPAGSRSQPGSDPPADKLAAPSTHPALPTRAQSFRWLARAPGSTSTASLAPQFRPRLGDLPLPHAPSRAHLGCCGTPRPRALTRRPPGRGGKGAG
ncbi:proline-rich protein 2-like [Ochotona curzoniae]|uniref:proline-rich protein 2-like n=1 Tax=Ochotona curzoniae TaxID=130825 RepID=UPI001B352E16|nr:proline-rich protein 2-like [Ochotona curzoniae]